MWHVIENSMEGISSSCCAYHGQRIFALTLGLCALYPCAVLADPLMGNVGAVLDTPWGVDKNPANAGFVHHSQLQVGGDYHNSEAKFRTPGATTINSNYSGVGITDIPASVIKITPHWGLGIMGMSLHANIKGGVDHMPVLLLNQANYLDISAHITQVNTFRLTNGFRFNEYWGVGFDLSYADVSGDITGKQSGTESDLFDLGFNHLNMVSARIGLRLEPIPRKLMFGVVTNPYTSRRIGSLSFSSPMLAGTDGMGNMGNMMSGDVNQIAGMTTRGFDDWLVGSGLVLGSFATYVDCEYQRKPDNTKTFSMTKMKVAPGDYHDVLSFRLGTKVGVPQSVISPFCGKLNLLGGLHYEPTNLGAGTAGQSGVAGINPMMLLATNLTKGPMAMVDDISSLMGPVGIGSHAPFWSVGGGTELKVWHSKSQHKGDPLHSREGFYRLSLVGGLYLKKESLGVGPDGDDPFAYEKKSVGAVGYLIYRY